MSKKSPVKKPKAQAPKPEEPQPEPRPEAPPEPVIPTTQPDKPAPAVHRPYYRIYLSGTRIPQVAGRKAYQRYRSTSGNARP